jgi:serine/threonine-protein kinase ULK/ATG1
VSAAGLSAFSELEAMRAISHPNVIRCYDAFCENGRIALIFEFCRGGTLSDEIVRHPEGLPVNRFLEIARQVVSALRAIHELGLAHNDVKPSNMLFADRERRVLRLADFGCIGRAGTARSAAGTWAYQAPEIWAGVVYDSQKADVFALGVTFCRMLSGRLPWRDAPTTAELRGRIMACDADLSCADPRILGMLRRMIAPESVRVTVASLAAHPLFAPAPALPRLIGSRSGPIPRVANLEQADWGSLIPRVESWRPTLPALISSAGAGSPGECTGIESEEHE